MDSINFWYVINANDANSIIKIDTAPLIELVPLQRSPLQKCDAIKEISGSGILASWMRDLEIPVPGDI